jgi:autotransporter-associated beta strand protein
MKTKPSLLACAVALGISLAGVRPVQAATLYWDTTIGGWNSTANWSTVSSGAAGNNPSVVPGTNDTVIISATAITGAPSISLNANEAATGLVIGSGSTEGAVTIGSGATSGYVLTIGTGGITTVANAGALTLSSNMGVALNGNQSWGGTQLITLNGALTGTGNLTVTGLYVGSTATANFNGSLTYANGGVTSDFGSSAFLNGITGGITFNGPTVGVQAALNITNTLNFVGTTNWYTNGNNETFSGSLTGGTAGTGVFNEIGSGIMTISGTTDNTNLSLILASGTTYLGKTSSASVHAVEKALTISTGATVQIIGSGGYQLGSNTTVSDSGIFDFNGDSETFASLSGTGIITNSSSSNTSTIALGGNNASTTFSGIIQNGASGAGVVALTKNGTGTLTLSGPNTYTGSTIINGGTLTLSGGNTGGGAVTVNSGAIFGADDSALTSTQSGTVTPASDFSSSATVTLNASTLQATGHTSAAGETSNVTWVSNIQLSMASTAGLTLGELITGPGIPANTYITGIPNGTNIYVNAAGTTNFGTVSGTFASLTYDTDNTIGGLTLNVGADAVTAALNSQGSVNTLGYNVLNLNGITRNAGSTVNFTLPTGAQSTLNEITTTTSNTNFTGGQQTIMGGYATVGGTTWAVSAATGGSAGAISGLTAYNTGFVAGTDVEAGDATSTPGAMTINSLRFNTAGAATVNTAGNLVVASGGILETSNVGANAVAINNNSITSGNGQDLIVIQNNTSTGMTIGSAITDNGGTSIGFTKSGSGTVTLNGANTYSGATYLTGGTTNVGNSSSLGNGAGAVTLSGGSNLSFTNGLTSVVLPTSAGAWQSSSNWRNTPNNINGVGSYQVGANGGSTAQPDFVLVNLGASYNLGQLNVTFANSYQVLQFYTASSSYAFSSLFNANGNSSASPSTLNLGDFTADSAVFGTVGTNAAEGATSFTLSGITGQYLAMYCTTRISNGYGFDISNLSLTTAQGGALTQSVGSLSSSDPTTSVSLFPSVTLDTGTNNTSTTFAGNINGSGTLAKVGTGTFTLTGSDSYTGGTVIGGGVLNVGGTNALAGGGAIAFSGGTLQYSGSNQADYSGLIANSGSAISIDTNGQSVTFASGLASSNTGGLTKLGSGTLTLTGSSSYSGATTVSAGTMLVNGSLNTQSSALTVNSGATLGGNGTINRPVTFNSGAIFGSTGNTLNVNAAVTLGSTYVQNWNYTGGTGDDLNITGALTTGSPTSATLNLISSAFNPTGLTFTLMSWTSGSPNITWTINNGSLSGVSTTATWSGGGDNVTWGSGANWNLYTATGAAVTGFSGGTVAEVGGTSYQLSGVTDNPSPVSTDTVTIAPSTGVTANGPTASTTLVGLTLGGASGSSDQLTLSTGGGLAVTGTTSVNATGSLLVNNANLQTGALGLSGNASVGAGETLTVTGAATVSGTANLSANGTSGNLAAFNNTGGTLTVSGGTVNFGTYSTATLPNATLSGGSTTINAGSISASLSNNANLTVTGATVGSLSWNSNYTGVTTLNAGTTYAAPVIAATSGGTFNLNNAMTSLAVSGAGSTTILGNGASVSGTLTATAGTLDVANSSTAVATVGTADLSSGGAIVNTQAGSLAITNQLKLSGGVTATYTAGGGATSFAASGANLSNTSTASTLTLSGGTLLFSPVSAPATIGVVNLSGTASAGPNDPGTTTAISLSGVTVSSGADALIVELGERDNLTTAGGGAPPATLSWNGQTLTLVGLQASSNTSTEYSAIYDLFNPTPGTATLTGTLPVNIFEYGLSAFSLSNVNTSGVTGTNGHDVTTGTQTNSVALTSSTAGTFAAVEQSVRLSTTGTLNSITSTSGSGVVTWNADNLDANASSYGGGYVSGIGAGSVTITGSMSATNGSRNEIEAVLFAPNNVQVGLSLPNTSFAATASSTLNMGTTGLYDTLGGLNLTAGATPTVLTLQNAQSITFGGITATGTGSATLTGTSAPIAIASGSNISVGSSALLTIQSPIVDGTGASTAITKTGAGLLALTGTNTYSGVNTVSAGTLEFVAPTALYDGSTAFWTGGKINVASGATLAVAVGGSGFTQSNVHTLFTGGIFNATSATTGLQAGAAVAFDTTGGNFTQGSTIGAIANSTGANGGAIGVTKLGANTLTLDQANTYTGATTVSAGTLIVSGSLSGTVSASVASGATLEVDGSANNAATISVAGALQGTGSVGAITANGGALSAGLTAANSLASSGTLTAAGAVTLSGSTNFNIRVGMLAGGTDGDQLNVTGNNTVSLNGANLQLTLGGYFSDVVGTVYTIINDPNVAVTGTFSEGSTITAGGYLFNILYDENAAGTGSGTGVDLQVAAIPEPGTWATFALGAILLLRFQTKRRRWDN